MQKLFFSGDNVEDGRGSKTVNFRYKIITKITVITVIKLV